MKKSLCLLLIFSMLAAMFAFSGAAPAPEERGGSAVNEYILSVAQECAEDFIKKASGAYTGGDPDGVLLRQILTEYADACRSFDSAVIFSGGPEYRPDPILSFAGYYIYGPSNLNYSDNLISMLLPVLSGSLSVPCPKSWTEDVCVLLGNPGSRVYLWVMLTRENGGLSAGYAALERKEGEDLSQYREFLEVYNSICFFPELTFGSPYGDWDTLGQFTNIPDGGEPAAPADTDALAAYLTLLEQERSRIEGYTWQMGYYGYGVRTPDQVPHPVVIRDVWGDDAPELIYVRKDSEYAARMRILTWEDGQVRELYSAQCDVQVAGGERYYLYQLGDEKALHIYISTGDEWWSNTYYDFAPTAERTMERVKHLERISHPGEIVGNVLTFVNEYTLDGQTVTEDEFTARETQIQADTSCILLYNTGSGDFAKDYVAQNGCPAMTCEEAIAWLRDRLGSDASEPAWSLAYRDFVLNRSFLMAGDPYRGYGDLENGPAVVTFALNDIDADGTPELLIFNGFNGRDLQANYVFTYTGSGVAYCGSTRASVYMVADYPGLFSTLTATGAYLDDQYAGQYSEVTYLDYYSLYGTELRTTSVSVTGRPLSSAGSSVLSRTPNAVLYAASQRSTFYLSALTWTELNAQGWSAFTAPYRNAESQTVTPAAPGAGPNAADMAGCDDRVVVPDDASWLPDYEKKIVNASLGVCIILRWAPVDEYVMEGYNFLGRVWQGETVTVLARQGNYSLIRTAAGDVGWATSQFLNPAW